jgi:hypothetical protein
MLEEKSNASSPPVYDQVTYGDDQRMARSKLKRRNALKTAALVWSLWRWLPSKQRGQFYTLARRHGPWLVGRELRRRRKRRSR